MVQQTSIEAYRESENTRITLKMQVYEVIKKARHPSNRDLSRLTGKEINVITPRVNELVHDGLVRQGGTKTDPFTKRRCIWWEVVA